MYPVYIGLQQELPSGRSRAAKDWFDVELKNKPRLCKLNGVFSLKSAFWLVGYFAHKLESY